MNNDTLTYVTYRAGSGVSPARHGAWATPLIGRLPGATTEKINNNNI